MNQQPTKWKDFYHFTLGVCTGLRDILRNITISYELNVLPGASRVNHFRSFRMNMYFRHNTTYMGFINNN